MELEEPQWHEIEDAKGEDAGVMCWQTHEINAAVLTIASRSSARRIVAHSTEHAWSKSHH